MRAERHGPGCNSTAVLPAWTATRAQKGRVVSVSQWIVPRFCVGAPTWEAPAALSFRRRPAWAICKKRNQQVFLPRRSARNGGSDLKGSTMGQPLGKPRNLRDLRVSRPSSQDSLGLGPMEYDSSNPASPQLQFGTTVVRQSEDFEAHQLTGTKK